MNTKCNTALNELKQGFSVIEQPVIGVSIAHSPDLVSKVKGFRMDLDFFTKSPPNEKDIRHLKASLEGIKKEYFGKKEDKTEYELFPR